MRRVNTCSTIGKQRLRTLEGPSEAYQLPGLACRRPVTALDCPMMTSSVRRQHVLPRLASLDPAFADEVMLRVVGRLPMLATQDAGITDVLRTLPFVPTASGARKAPSELHDPR